MQISNNQTIVNYCMVRKKSKFVTLNEVKGLKRIDLIRLLRFAQNDRVPYTDFLRNHHWILNIGIYLKLGIWDLVIVASTILHRVPAPQGRSGIRSPLSGSSLRLPQAEP